MEEIKSIAGSHSAPMEAWRPEPKVVLTDGQVVVHPRERIDWPDPTPEMLSTPEFEAVWNCIKEWDIAVPAAYGGYSGATGNHVRAILEALKSAKLRNIPPGPPNPPRPPGDHPVA